MPISFVQLKSTCVLWSSLRNWCSIPKGHFAFLVIVMYLIAFSHYWKCIKLINRVFVTFALFLFNFPLSIYLKTTFFVNVCTLYQPVETKRSISYHFYKWTLFTRMNSVLIWTSWKFICKFGVIYNEGFYRFICVS